VEQQQGGGMRMHGAVSERTVGAVTAIVFFLVGVVMIVDNYKIGAGWAPEGRGRLLPAAHRRDSSASPPRWCCSNRFSPRGAATVSS